MPVRPQRILHIDDDTLSCQVVRDALAEIGATLEQPTSWEEFLTAVDGLGSEDIVISDGTLWGGRTANDVWEAIVSRVEPFFIVYYAGAVGAFPLFSSIRKPDLKRLQKAVKRFL